MHGKIVIGFMGLAGAGKTTAAVALSEFVGDDCEILSFASPLKKAIKQLFMLTDAQVYGTKEEKEVLDSRWLVTPRHILQMMGTECIRNSICKDFFVLRMCEEIKASAKSTIIIDDVRFPDETLVCDYLVVIERSRLPVEELECHASEAVPRHMANLTINNDNLELNEFQDYVVGTILRSGVLTS